MYDNQFCCIVPCWEYTVVIQCEHVGMWFDRWWMFVLNRLGSDCWAAAGDVYYKSKGQLGETRIWKARWIKAFSNESRGSSVADTWCWSDIYIYFILFHMFIYFNLFPTVYASLSCRSNHTFKLFNQSAAADSKFNWVAQVLLTVRWQIGICKSIIILIEGLFKDICCHISS